MGKPRIGAESHWVLCRAEPGALSARGKLGVLGEFWGCTLCVIATRRCLERELCWAVSCFME